MSWITDLLQDIPLSAVLREKIGLIETKYKEAEKQIDLLTSQNKALQARNEQLESDNMQLVDQIEHLAQKSDHKDLGDLELRILHCVAQLDYGHCTAAVIRTNFFADLSIERVKYYLQKLDQRNCIRSGVIDQLGAHYGLTQTGREVLLEKDLL
jgi:hypothetical protein